MLMHKMVHHIQNMAGLKFACPEEREKMAFEGRSAGARRAYRRLWSGVRTTGSALLFAGGALLAVSGYAMRLSVSHMATWDSLTSNERG